MIVSNELGIECVIFCTEQGTNSSGMKMSTKKRKREREKIVPEQQKRQ